MNLWKRMIKFDGQLYFNFLGTVKSKREVQLLLDGETKFRCNITAPMRLCIIYQLAIRAMSSMIS